MSVYAVAAKALHPKIIYKAVFLNNLNLCFYLLIRYLQWNKTKSNTETIAFKIT